MRRLRALIAGLPRTSALARATNPEAAAEWGNAEELLAGLTEAVDELRRILFVGLRLKGTPRSQLKIPRPGGHMVEPPAPATRPVSMSSPEARAFFGGADVTYTPTEN